MFVNMNTHIAIRIHTYLYIYTHKYTHAYIHIHMSTCIHIYVQIYIEHIYTHVYICIYTHIYIYSAYFCACILGAMTPETGVIQRKWKGAKIEGSRKVVFLSREGYSPPCSIDPRFLGTWVLVVYIYTEHSFLIRGPDMSDCPP